MYIDQIQPEWGPDRAIFSGSTFEFYCCTGCAEENDDLGQLQLVKILPYFLPKCGCCGNPVIQNMTIRNYRRKRYA